MISDQNKPLANELASTILNELQQGNQITSASLLEASMNILMEAERRLHLDNNPLDKANGYFTRKLGTPMGSLNLTVPRDRDGDFRPAILPKPYQRDYQEREEILKALIMNGYSTQQIQRSLHSLNLHYNPEEIDALKSHYLELFEQLQQRELSQDVIALFIDAYHADALIDGKVRKAVIYVIIGVDFSGAKSLYGLYLYKGNESKTYWLQTLNQLITRGVKTPLFIVSDDFSGLKEAIHTLYPDANHQLCFIHMQRNIYKNMGKEDAKSFNQTLQAIKCVSDSEQAETQFKQLCQSYTNKYSAYMQLLESKATHYFAFMKLPPDIRKFFYTTNTVESFNSMLEKCRIRMGGFFQSESCLQVNVFLSVNRLEQHKWKNGIPLIKSNLYEVRQVFATQYGRLPLT